MISPEPAEGLGPLQAKHGIGAHLLGLEDDDLESFHPQLGNNGAFVTTAGFDADPPGCMRAKPSNENRMAVGIIVNLEAPGMAINSHVEFALSGIDSGANESRLFRLPRPCLVNANLMFRQPYGSDEELKAILLSHSPQGYG